ncbi:MAG: hypothetical protein ABJD24_16335 [Acidimicrobiales bacterium]
MTTSAGSPPPATNAPSSSPTSQLPTTTATTVQPINVTTTTTASATLFDPAQCANWLYFLLHWGQCRAALPPPSSKTSTTHGRED